MNAEEPDASEPRAKAKAARHFYRRNLPHIQGRGGPILLTFCTKDRWILPPEARDVVLRHCLHDHGHTYELLCCVIMPDHVHMLYRPNRDATGQAFPLEEITHAIKGSSAHSINKLLKRRGSVWQDESFDHVTRSSEAINQKALYVVLNPVRKGLCNSPRDYPWLWVNPVMGLRV